MEKLEKFLEAKGKIVIFVVMVLFLASVIWINASNTIFQIGHDSVENEEYVQYTEPINVGAGKVIKSKIEKPYDHAKYFALKFGTANIATGTLEVTILKEEEVIKSWNVEVDFLVNNDYKKFDISNIKFDKNFTYYIEVSNKQGMAENISLYMMEDEIVYQYYYSYIDSTVLLIALGIVIICIIIFLYYNVAKEKVMLFTLLVLEILYFWLLPIGIAPDEENHFFRAFEISLGKLVSEHVDGSDLGGNYLPVGLENYQNPTAELDWENNQVYYFENTALYAPISYLPQAIGIKLATFFTKNVSIIFYFGRFGAAIVNFLLGVWALKKMPFGKEILFLIMLFPMTMQEMISMAADGFTTALAFALVAYVLHLAYEKEKVETRDLIILTVMATCLAMCKIVYIVIVAVIFIIPASKFRTNKKAILWKSGIIGITLLINLIWLMKSSTYLIEFMPGVQSKRQIYYILTHIGKYYVTIIHTMLIEFQGWVQTMFGSNLGSLNIPLSPIMWIMYMLLLSYETITCKVSGKKLRCIDVLCYIVIFFAGAGLICTSLYVQWTAYVNSTISGIQGRYFIPIIIFLLLPFVYFQNMKTTQKVSEETYNCERKIFMYLLLVFFNGMALVEMLEFKLTYYLLNQV